MEHLFLRVFLGSPKFWLTGRDVLNEQQQSRNAVGFNKNASQFAWGGFVQRWRGQKSTIFVSYTKNRRCLPGGGGVMVGVVAVMMAEGKGGGCGSWQKKREELS